jgi:hypothetical protein
LFEVSTSLLCAAFAFAPGFISLFVRSHLPFCIAQVELTVIRVFCRSEQIVIESVLLVNFVATAVMTGVIWFVQWVHYPLLATVPIDRAVETAVEHQRRTGQVLALPMAAEGVTTLWLLVSRPDAVSLVLPWLGAVLLAVALGSTMFLSVPLHSKMATNPTAEVGRRLVVTNWPRTIAWSARTVVCAVMLLQVVRA